MKGSTSLKFFISAIALCLSGSALTAALTPLQSQLVTQKNVIVILRDQMPNLPPARRAMGARSAALAAAQSQVLAALPRVATRKVRGFATINAFATTVSAAEAAQLTAHPMVQAVVPDAVIRTPVHGNRGIDGSGGGAGLSASAAATDGGLCNTLEPEALQLTHTAFADPSIPQAQQVRDGHGQFVTGKGVKVAYIADGLDPTVQGFTRPDGSSVFIDYQDFSGDPAGTPTAGGEAFGDASSIAAQNTPNNNPLNFDISLFVNPAHPLPSPCNIQIRGMAPGASLVGLKVFSAINATLTSNFVQAIEYAFVNDDVDVINESFGGAPFPDNADDPISLANDAAVAAGVTVVVSTGDAGTNGTLGSPSTEPSVIAAGASTQFRSYAQTGYGAAPFANGYLDNNISAFSSGGFSQRSARTVDVVAPGDLGWALCSSNTALYQDCTSYNGGAATPIESFGGTSESAPLTSGEAALVIQAYRSTHGGADPSPALVKQIIMSTATDLGAPASEQGAGLINALAAVNAALSVQDGHGRPAAQGSSLLNAPSSASFTAAPNQHESQSFTVTNTGSVHQHLAPALQTLGPSIAGASLSLQLNPATDPTFPNVTGAPRSYIEKTFIVPKGVQHLDAAIAWQVSSGATPIAYLGLLDPSGKDAAYTIPQGAGSGYGHVDVVNPAAGKWTAIIWTRPTGVADSYSGPVQFTWAAEDYVSIGSVWPSSFDLAPGESRSITAEWSMPSQPGDSAAAIRFDNAGLSQIPVTLRTLIPVGRTGGNFTGTLTGGNARPGAGPTQTFAFDVPRGVDNMSLTLEIADNGYLLEGLLVDPQGMQLSVEPNQDPLSGNALYALQLYHNNPQPGRWKFVLLQNFTSSGNQTSLPFTARIGFNGAQIIATGLPNSASVTLSASAPPLTVPIQVTNTGAVTQLYFADARLGALTVTQLATQPCSGIATLPGACGLFYLPTQVSGVAFLAQSTVPITMDAYNDVGAGVGGTGSPDIYAAQVAPDTVVAYLAEPEVPYSIWISAPSQIGPYGPAGVPTEPVTTTAFVQMKAFDASATADSGDLWADLTLGTNTFNPLILAPGQTGTINVTITPDPGQVGNTVTGYVYIDTFNPVVSTGDEVVRIPYSYTVAP